MTLAFKNRFTRLFKPAGDDGADTSGTGLLDHPGDDDLEIDPDLDPENPDAGDPRGKVDPDADPDAPADGKPAKRDARIPLSRHKEMLARERAQREAAEQRLAQYERGQQVSRTNEELTKAEDGILKMERDYNKLLADGEIEKASELMTKIRQAERAITESKAELRAQTIEVRAREAARYDIVLERIEEAYPALNEDSDEYDPEMLADVADLKAVYQKRGMPPSRALQEAVKKLMGQKSKDQAQATDVTPRVAEKDVAAERKKLAAGKAADANRRTPPNARDVGLDSDKAGGGLSPKDVMNMSQDDFDKLTEEQLAKLRGDK